VAEASVSVRVGGFVLLDYPGQGRARSADRNALGLVVHARTRPLRSGLPRPQSASGHVSLAPTLSRW
jgi:hypothetical protein